MENLCPPPAPSFAALMQDPTPRAPHLLRTHAACAATVRLPYALSSPDAAFWHCPRSRGRRRDAIQMPRRTPGSTCVLGKARAGRSSYRQDRAWRNTTWCRPGLQRETARPCERDVARLGVAQAGCHERPTCGRRRAPRPRFGRREAVARKRVGHRRTPWLRQGRACQATRARRAR